MAWPPRTRNVHFDDDVVAGDLRFDYRLKPGPVTRSNALAIMRAVGLDVPEADAASEPPRADAAASSSEDDPAR